MFTQVSSSAQARVFLQEYEYGINKSWFGHMLASLGCMSLRLAQRNTSKWPVRKAGCRALVFKASGNDAVSIVGSAVMKAR